jgi:hypothetical protein
VVSLLSPSGETGMVERSTGEALASPLTGTDSTAAAITMCFGIGVEKKLWCYSFRAETVKIVVARRITCVKITRIAGDSSDG